MPALYEQIRQRALKQYVSPFMSVNLTKMAQSFNTTAQGRLRWLPGNCPNCLEIPENFRRLEWVGMAHFQHFPGI